MRTTEVTHLMRDLNLTGTNQSNEWASLKVSGLTLVQAGIGRVQTRARAIVGTGVERVSGSEFPVRNT